MQYYLSSIKYGLLLLKGRLILSSFQCWGFVILNNYENIKILGIMVMQFFFKVVCLDYELDNL